MGSQNGHVAPFLESVSSKKGRGSQCQLIKKHVFTSGLFSSQTEVIAEAAVQAPLENLPPVGPLNRYELRPEDFCFAMKYSLFARWVQAQVIEVDKREQCVS